VGFLVFFKWESTNYFIHFL